MFLRVRDLNVIVYGYRAARLTNRPKSAVSSGRNLIASFHPW